MDRMSSIELALKNEETEMKWYLEQAERSSNSLAIAMFKELAKDEAEHMRRIRGLHGKLTAGGEWPAEMPIDVAGTNVKDVLDNLLGDTSAAAGQDADDIAALEKAIEFEANGSKFYAELAGECGNPQEKAFFTFLSGIEREHHLSLTQSLAYLRDPDGWMMEEGRSGLDGA